jgi:DNA polymerase lambda
MEIVETGALRRVDAERTEDVAAVQLFQGIYGVGMQYLLHLPLGLAVPIAPPPPGQSTAHAWYLAGCRTLEDVKQRKGGIELSHVQVIGLKFYDGALSHPLRWVAFLILMGPDINARMPREEASEIFEEIKSIGEPSLLIGRAWQSLLI